MSEPSASYAALIPALDCAATIAEVVRGCREHVSLVLVVDDGSSDATADEARSAGAEVCSHGENLGKGAALVSGLRYLEERGFSHAVSVDGDGIGQALELYGATRLEALTASAAGQRFGHLRQQDLPPHGVVTQPRRLDHRTTEVVLLLACHLADGDADPHEERLATTAVVPVECLLHGHGAADGVGGGTEHDHQPIAEVLHLGPGGLAYGLP